MTLNEVSISGRIALARAERLRTRKRESERLGEEGGCFVAGFAIEISPFLPPKKLEQLFYGVSPLIRLVT